MATIGQFKTIFYVILGLCILTTVIAFTSFDFIETDLAADWTMKYFALPILVVMTPVSYFIYLKFLRQHEGKKYKSKMWTNLRTIFRIVILTCGLTAILFATTLSIILLSNSSGDNRTINLNAIIVDYHSTNNRGRINHYIRIQDSQLNRVVELKVKRQFAIGQPFTESMKIGKWGLLYSE